jgi:hypothetical protein
MFDGTSYASNITEWFAGNFCGISNIHAHRAESPRCSSRHIIAGDLIVMIQLRRFTGSVDLIYCPHRKLHFNVNYSNAKGQPITEQSDQTFGNLW